MAYKVEELWILAGVTAAGKTELSLEWAERNDAEIISCDSVSFYRGLDIGSAKPGLKDQKRVVHHGLDLADVSEVFDVGQFHAYANEVIEDMVSRGKKVLVVGGSGFFLQGFLQPVVDALEVSDEVRNHVNTTYEKYGLDTTLAQLGKLNPKGLGNLDTRNPLRVIRALERCLQSERSLIDLQKDFEKLPIPYAQFTKRMVWLDRKNDEIMDRINLRTQSMIDGGMIEEAEQAIRAGILRHPSLSQSVGYREIIKFIKEGGPRRELVSSIVQSTRQLVSKQRKWFRKHFPAGSCLQVSTEKPLSVDQIPWVAGT